MEITKVAGTGGSRGKRFVVAFYQQWDGLLMPWRASWIDFTLVKIAGEVSRYKGSCELEIWCLGLGVTFTYIYDSSFVEAMSDAHDALMADLKGATGASEVADKTGALEQFKGDKR